MATEFDRLRARILHDAGEDTTLTGLVTPASQPAHMSITVGAAALQPAPAAPSPAAQEQALLQAQLSDARRSLAASQAENQQLRYEKNELLRLLGDQTLNRHLNTQHVSALQRLEESHSRKLAHGLQVASDAAAAALERGVKEPTRLLAQSRKDHALTQARLTAANLQLRGCDAVRGKALTKLLTGVPISTVRRCSKNGWYKGRPGPRGPGGDDLGGNADAVMDDSEDEAQLEGQDQGAAGLDPGDMMDEDEPTVLADNPVLARAGLDLALQSSLQQQQQQTLLTPAPIHRVQVGTSSVQQQQRQPSTTSALNAHAPAAVGAHSIQHVLAGLNRHRKIGPSAAAISTLAAAILAPSRSEPVTMQAGAGGSNDSTAHAPQHRHQQLPITTTLLAHVPPSSLLTSSQQLLINTLTSLVQPPLQSQTHTLTSNAVGTSSCPVLASEPGTSKAAATSLPPVTQAGKPSRATLHASLAELLALQRTQANRLAAQAPPPLAPQPSVMVHGSTVAVSSPPLPLHHVQAPHASTTPAPSPPTTVHALQDCTMPTASQHPKPRTLPQADTLPTSAPQAHTTQGPAQRPRKAGSGGRRPVPVQASPLRPINSSIFKSLVRLRKALMRPQPDNLSCNPTLQAPPQPRLSLFTNTSSLSSPAAPSPSRPALMGTPSSTLAPSQSQHTMPPLTASSSCNTSATGAALTQLSPPPQLATVAIPTILAPQVLAPQAPTAQIVISQGAATQTLAPQPSTPQISTPHTQTTSILAPEILAQQALALEIPALQIPALQLTPQTPPPTSSATAVASTPTVSLQVTSSSVTTPALPAATGQQPSLVQHVTSGSSSSSVDTSTGPTSAMVPQVWHPSAVASFLSKPTAGQNAQLALQAMLQYYQAQVKPIAAQGKLQQQPQESPEQRQTTETAPGATAILGSNQGVAASSSTAEAAAASAVTL